MINDDVMPGNYDFTVIFPIYDQLGTDAQSEVGFQMHSPLFFNFHEQPNKP